MFDYIYHFSDPNDLNPTDTIQIEDLPKCKHCNRLLRPYIVWFGENLDTQVMERSSEFLRLYYENNLF